MEMRYRFIRACVLIAFLAGGFLYICWCKGVAAQVVGPGPSSINLANGKAYMVEGQPAVIAFSGGNDAGDPIVLQTDLSFLDWPEECQYDAKDEQGIVCPTGAYTATVYPEFIMDDVYVGFTLRAGESTLLAREVPLVKKEGVTPFLVHEIDRTNEAMTFEVWLTNQGPKPFTEEVVVTVDPPGADNDIHFDLKDVTVPVGGSVATDPMLLIFEDDGLYTVTIRVLEQSYSPMGGYFSYTRVVQSKLYLPALENTD